LVDLLPLTLKNLKIPGFWWFTSLGSFESVPNEAIINERIITNIVSCFSVFFGGFETLKNVIA
jgi:hypothetical protein